VSWNIRLGEEVDAAIAELQTVESLRNAACFFCRKWTRKGSTGSRGAELQLCPLSGLHPYSRTLLWRAVLSKWPIFESMKIILPHASPANQQRCIAVGAIAAVANIIIAAYSVHTETPALSAAKRDEQVEHLPQEIALGGHERVVVGEDFDPVSASSRATLLERMEALDLVPVTGGPLTRTRKRFL
jgi:hypothetical protein